MSWEHELGKSIRQARAKKRWSQDQLGAELGVHKNTVRSYEKGRTTPDFAEVRKIAMALEEDHFEIGDGMRLEFSRNGRPKPEPAPPLQLLLRFDEKKGVTVRIESAEAGIVVKSVSA